MSSPQLSAPNVWSRFTADPRVHPAVRASDADRDVAVELLNEAYQDGRLDALEHVDRLEAAMRAKTLGDLVPRIQDLVAPTAPAASAVAAPSGTSRGVRVGALASWALLAAMLNAIWFLSWFLSGDAPYYYWPAWPMLGTLIPVLSVVLGMAAGDRVKERRIAQGRPDRRAERRERRELGR